MIGDLLVLAFLIYTAYFVYTITTEDDKDGNKQ